MSMSILYVAYLSPSGHKEDKYLFLVVKSDQDVRGYTDLPRCVCVCVCVCYAVLCQPLSVVDLIVSICVN